MNNELKELREIYKDLYSKSIYAYTLEIIDELECQTDENELTDEEYQKLYYEIEHAWFKLDGVSIETITRCALENKDKIMNDDEDFDLREESCWY